VDRRPEGPLSGGDALAHNIFFWHFVRLAPDLLGYLPAESVVLIIYR